MKNILFFGGSSLLASIWSNYWKDDFNIFMTQHQQPIEVDRMKLIKIKKITSFLVKKIIKTHDIDLLINCVGLTSVERCEADPIKANYLNVKIPSILANVCFQEKIRFLHISTDHLFKGTKSLRSESDIPNPINQYGVTKFRGEQEVQKNNPDSLIIRTNFFGLGPVYRPSFSDIIMKSLEKKEAINLFDDVFFTPIHVHELAEIVFNLLKRKEKGILNVVSNERISKYEFGLLIADQMGVTKHLILKTLISERKDLVTRPKDMSLSNHKIKTKLNFKVKSIENQLKSMINLANRKK